MADDRLQRQHLRLPLRSTVVLLAIIALVLFVPSVLASASDNGHNDPIAPVILGVTGILFFAVIGRFVARKLNQPSVLGELIMGVVLGNVAYLLNLDLIAVLREGSHVYDMIEYSFSGMSLQQAAEHALGKQEGSYMLSILQGEHGAELLQVAHTVDVFSRYGVIFLLFLVGLETSVDEMRAVGIPSARVAVAGVAFPFLFGFVAVKFLMPELPLGADLFIAATLGATSIGITASVLQDLDKQNTHEARIILGAAVIDDILGLLMLAIVSGIVVSGDVNLTAMAKLVFLAVLFLGAAIWLGPHFLRRTIPLVSNLDLVEAKMFVSYLFVMVLAWFASFVGLATIIGAFTAGLILHDAYFKHWGEHTTHRYSIKDLIMPLEVILVPIFFVLMGIQVKLETFLHPHVLIMATGLLVAAVLGKLLCGYFAGRGVNHLAVGIGMLPRGEVGLIFAAIGKTLGVIDDTLFAAIVLMVILTTLAAPPLLKRKLTKT